MNEKFNLAWFVRPQKKLDRTQTKRREQKKNPNLLHFFFHFPLPPFISSEDCETKKWKSNSFSQDGSKYFYNKVTKESTWAVPQPLLRKLLEKEGKPPLPPGWILLYSETGKEYYYNQVTNVSQWTLPTIEEEKKPLEKEKSPEPKGSEPPKADVEKEAPSVLSAPTPSVQSIEVTSAFSPAQRVRPSPPKKALPPVPTNRSKRATLNHSFSVRSLTAAQIPRTVPPTSLDSPDVPSKSFSRTSTLASLHSPPTTPTAPTIPAITVQPPTPLATFEINLSEKEMKQLAKLTNGRNGGTSVRLPQKDKDVTLSALSVPFLLQHLSRAFFFAFFSSLTGNVTEQGEKFFVANHEKISDDSNSSL
jgi:hypothetical protein